MSRFAEVAHEQAAKDMDALREEFDGLSDQYLSREADRINNIARQAASDSARLRAEMMRRALSPKEPET